VIAAVRRRSAHVPVVFVTDGEPAVVREAFDRGVTAHVRRGDGAAFADALAARVEAAVAHAETERERLRSRTAVETRGTAVAAVDAAGRFETAGPAYRALVGSEESTLVGAPLSAAHPEGDAERLRAAAAETDSGEEWAGTVLAVRGETPVRLRVVLTPRPDEDGFTLLATQAAEAPVLGSADSRR
jgi:PAS domain-containing protein